MTTDETIPTAAETAFSYLLGPRWPGEVDHRFQPITGPQRTVFHLHDGRVLTVDGHHIARTVVPEAAS